MPLHDQILTFNYCLFLKEVYARCHLCNKVSSAKKQMQSFPPFRKNNREQKEHLWIVPASHAHSAAFTDKYGCALFSNRQHSFFGIDQHQKVIADVNSANNDGHAFICNSFAMFFLFVLRNQLHQICSF